MPIDRSMGEGVIVENSDMLVTVDGELRVATNIVASEDTINQYREGYRCMECHAIQDEPFPKVCKARDVTVPDGWRCGYEMRADQAMRFQREFKGEQYYGPTPLSQFDDEREREAWKPKTGILLPGKDF